MNRATLNVLALTTVSVLSTAALASGVGGLNGSKPGDDRGTTATQVKTVGTTTTKLSPAAQKVDIDRSGTITVNDLHRFVEAWNQGRSWTDVDGDGGVTADDINVFLARWSAAYTSQPQV